MSNHDAKCSCADCQIARARGAAPELLVELVRALSKAGHSLDCRTQNFADECDCWRRSARKLVAKVRGE